MVSNTNGTTVSFSIPPLIVIVDGERRELYPTKHPEMFLSIRTLLLSACEFLDGKK